MYLFGAPPAWWRYKWFHSQSTMAVNCTGSSYSNMEMEGKLHFATNIVFMTFLTLYLFMRCSVLHMLSQYLNKICKVNLVDFSWYLSNQSRQKLNVKCFKNFTISFCKLYHGHLFGHFVLRRYIVFQWLLKMRRKKNIKWWDGYTQFQSQQ